MLILTSVKWVLIILLSATFFVGCKPATTEVGNGNFREMNTELSAALKTTRNSRILFSHHSVGGNILAGVERVDREADGEGKIRIVTAQQATDSLGPALIHVTGGKNGAPQSKIDFFSSTINGEPNLKPDLAFMKFCYVDFSPNTNVDELFDSYQRTLLELKRSHPEIRFGHVTVPLVERPTSLKWRLFLLVGKEVWEDEANVKRAKFNQLLKSAFAQDPIFDLAETEATTPDGNLTLFKHGGQSYMSLFPGYTDDGGHLNTLGQMVVGKAAISFIGETLRSSR